MAKRKRLAVIADPHSGHRVGLTHPDYQWKVPTLTAHIWTKVARIQRECWRWYAKTVKALRPVDVLLVNADCIDGRGERSGGVELITGDRAEQVEIAARAIELWGAKIIIMTRGCLTPGHRILTADLRWVPVETLQPGDKIVGFDANSPGGGLRRCWREATVTENVMVRKVVYDIHLSDGTKLTATGDHPFLVRAKRAPRWATVNQLRSWLYNLGGARRRRAAPLEFFRTFSVWDSDDTRRGGYLAGFFDGEGHCSYGLRKRRSHNNREEFVFRVAADQLDNCALHQVAEYLQQDGWRFSITSKHRERGRVISIGGFRTDKLHFLGRVRPHRLLEKVRWDDMGEVRGTRRYDNTHIVDITLVGNREVCGLSTSTGTYVSEGFLSHNTPYHTGTEEDWEDVLARRVRARKIGDHEWIDLNGIVFDFKHHVGRSTIPHGQFTPQARDWLWNALWAEAGYQPRADWIVRSHVHYARWCGGMRGGREWHATTTPALQAMGTRYGARYCSNLVDFGLMHWDVDGKGGVDWHKHIPKVLSQEARALKL